MSLDAHPKSPEGRPAPNPVTRENPDWIRVLRQHVASVRFGVIQVVIHEGRVVQIERTEKVRLTQRPASES